MEGSISTMLTAHSSQLTAHSHAVLFLIAPAYNESQNIAQFVEEWYPVVEKHDGEGLSRLVVIDDGSKDNTYAILQDLVKTRPLLQPLTKTNSGHGATCMYGYRYALEHGAEYIFQTDTDGQTSAQEFGAFWELRNEYDAVLGKRPERGDGASRKFVENVLRFILRLIFGVNVPDANAPFRLMKRGLLSKYLHKMPDDFNLPNVMLTTYFAYFHENVTFKAITFRPRQAGQNSINIRKIIAIGLKAVKDFLQLRRNINHE
ncbi:MAG: glycosyltransferase family 2 protein [Synergistaceae bacterium]|nr:glycosyltransferase family 2 protein [Synergistaceae bacterium]